MICLQATFFDVCALDLSFFSRKDLETIAITSRHIALLVRRFFLQQLIVAWPCRKDRAHLLQEARNIGDFFSPAWPLLLQAVEKQMVMDPVINVTFHRACMQSTKGERFLWRQVCIEKEIVRAFRAKDPNKSYALLLIVEELVRQKKKEKARELLPHISKCAPFSCKARALQCIKKGVPAKKLERNMTIDCCSWIWSIIELR